MKKQFITCSTFLLLLFVLINECQAVQTYDFESSNWQSLEQQIDPSAIAYAFQLTDATKRAGRYSGRFELRSGDVSHPGYNTDNERCELSEDSFILPENTTAFYGFSILIPASQLTDCGSVCREWRNLMQWHLWKVKDNPSDYWWHRPPLALALDDGKLSFIMMTTGDAEQEEYRKIVDQLSFTPGKWIDFVVAIKWSKTANQGNVRIWYGEQGSSLNELSVGDTGLFASGYSQENYTGVFWKFGIYRRNHDNYDNAVTDDDIVYFDELRRGISYNEVVPPPAAPTLILTVVDELVTLTWSDVPGATEYTLFYAPYPYAGPETIRGIDMGVQTHMSAKLWNGAAFYVAVQAKNGAGSSEYSNIEFILIK